MAISTTPPRVNRLVKSYQMFQKRHHCRLIQKVLYRSGIEPRSIYLYFRKKAFAVGFTILELSKLLMYQAWYDKICTTWPTARLLATDTDRYLV